MKDALGNEIIIGNAYGFASLKINNAFSSVYNDQPIDVNNQQKYEKVKVKPFMLFPI